MEVWGGDAKRPGENLATQDTPAECGFACPTICTRGRRAELLGSDGINYSLAGQRVLASIVEAALFPPEPQDGATGAPPM